MGKRGLLVLAAVLIYGCSAPQPPRDAVPPYVHWDATYAQPMGLIHSGVACRGGMIKVMFEFPEFDIAPIWVKADVVYTDGSCARMDIIARNCIYVAQAPGLIPEDGQVVHLQWLAEGYEVGHYRIMIRDYQMRPLPVDPPPPIRIPPPPDPVPDPTPPDITPGQLTQRP